MAVNELLKRYASGKRDFAWTNLREATLKGAKLTGINLSRANLTKANLARADLSQANLSKAILKEANLREANLTGSQLYKADLSGAKLDGTDLTGANISGVNLEGVNLSRAIMPNGKPYEQWLGSQQSEATLVMEETTSSANHPPVAALDKDANQSLDTVATPSRRETLSRTLFSRGLFILKEISIRLPLRSFLLLWLGYFFFGHLLTIYEAPLFAWVLTWAGSVLWVIDESLTWFVPITGAIALISAASISLVNVVVAVVITLIIILIMMALKFGVKKAFRDGIWVGMLLAAAIVTTSWFFEGLEELIGGGVFVALKFYRALALSLGIGATTIGSLAWISMDYVGFTLGQILPTVAGITWLGLCCGWTIGKLF